METKTPRSAIILTGGKGRRLGKVEKALLVFEGKTLLERLLDTLFLSVDEIILSVRDKTQQEVLNPILKKYPARKIRFCFDTLDDVGPLEGIRAGLLEASHNYAFVCACDMPFVNRKVVDLLFEKARGHDVALPRHNARMFESLHAVYSKKLIPEIEKALGRGDRFVLAPVFELEDVVYVDVSEIREIDPELLTFANINTVEDIERIVGES